MEIDINQKKISIGDKYQIFTDGVQTNRAAAKLFRFFAEINLFDTENDFPLMTIKRRFAFFKAKFDLTRKDGILYEFTTVSFWKSHFQCTAGRDMYDIYAHRGRKYSVYKNDKQVAWWDKNAVSWFNGDNYKIIADRDCDKILIISFCLAVDNYANSDKEKRTVNFNIGRLGPQARKFDAGWQPKY
ncbi:MAG: hypothetical protein QM726_08220 [Chitinophagaceae bacterium]